MTSVTHTICGVPDEIGVSTHLITRLLALGCILLLLTACATPAQRFDDTARQLGLQPTELNGKAFQHRVYHQTGARGALLHIYLDGDGTPWYQPWTIASDPTPRSALMLYLMQQDSAPSVYLGRPCYHAITSAGCQPYYWTHGRYAEAVVNSLAHAVEKLQAAGNYQGVVLIGYSGGGALAHLLAARVKTTRAVLTVAANLDHSHWTAWHGYSPLLGSLNAVDYPLSPSIVQLHWVGKADQQVPPQLVESAAKRLPGAIVQYQAGFDHRCCWQDSWPAILADLQQRLAQQMTSP